MSVVPAARTTREEWVWRHVKITGLALHLRLVRGRTGLDWTILSQQRPHLVRLDEHMLLSRPATGRGL